MPKAAADAKLLIQSLNKAYAATPTNLKVITINSHFLTLSRVCYHLWAVATV
jgi:oligosaccharyltransferase complex subunit epsilon